MVSVFGSTPATIAPFKDTFGDGDDFRMTDHVGKGVVIKVHGPEEINTRNGLKTAIKADVTTLDDLKDYTNVLIFNAAPVSQLSGSAGQTIVAQITDYETKAGGRAPKLTEPTNEDIARADKLAA